MLTGNKGEWSEIYALFKLLGDKKLHPGNSELKKLENLVYPILKIIRSEFKGIFEYSIEDDIVIISGNDEILRIPILEFQNKANILLIEIKKRSGTFSLPEIESFMQSINCFTLKAKSSAKTDITIKIHDQRTGHQPTLGFSIKSQLGNPSTLLNAGETTNFIFKIVNANISYEEINEINNISSSSKIKDRISEIKKRNGNFKFISTQRSIFSNNLILIDSLLPQILSNLLFKFYSTSKSNVLDLVKLLEDENPLNFDLSNNHSYYNYKIKRFLTDIALGMMPSRVWTGEYDTTGGFLIVKENGDILCYHIYNKNEFEDYLISNTKLETASSSRHGFGYIYHENGELFFKLNLQIRFK
jgi:hypothetical protein